MGITALSPGSVAGREIYAREFDDPDAYAVANGLNAAKTVGPVPAGFRARLARVDLGRVKIRDGEASAAVTMAGGIPDLHAFTFSTRPAAPRLLSGHEIPHLTLFHPRPNDILFGTSASGQPWPFATVAVSFETLAAAGAGWAGREGGPTRHDAWMTKAPEVSLRRLIGLIADAARIATDNPRIATLPAPSHALSGAILDALMACLSRGEATHDRAALRRHQRVMSRLEQVLDERAEDMLSLADICAAVGVAERTLHLACHEFLGTGAMQYVRKRRLEKVRTALANADPRADTVGEIAMRYGFWELGRFAGAYRARFGEPPSATLRRDRTRAA